MFVLASAERGKLEAAEFMDVVLQTCNVNTVVRGHVDFLVLASAECCTLEAVKFLAVI